MTDVQPESAFDEVIARFMREFEAANDKAGVVERFRAECPQYQSDFNDFAAMHHGLHAAAPEPSKAPNYLQPNEMLGDFRIVRFVAEGGMGEIYEAEQLALSRRRVALKVIRRGKVTPDARARFLREQQVLAKLHQTNIVPVFAAGEKDQLQFFAMQYIEGATLGHVVKWLGTRDRASSASSQTPSLGQLVEDFVGPSPGQALATVTQGKGTESTSKVPTTPPVLTDEYLRSVATSLADVADALEAAHTANVLHRDVKPSNLMAEKSGKCWVIDFGLAGLIGEADAVVASDGAANPSTTLTKTGGVMGTCAYMSPEQFDGRPEPRSDVWSLGVTMYELLTLQRPFAGPAWDQYSFQVHTTTPPAPRSLVRNMPVDLDAICRKAMRTDAKDRYPTAGDFATDLRRWLAHEPTVANPPSPFRRVAMWAKRKPGWAATVGVAFTALLGLFGMFLYLEQKETDAANAKADYATKELELKTSAAAEKERLHARQLKLIDFERERLSPRAAGWSDHLWQQGAILAAKGTDPSLRDGMAALRGGLDARRVAADELSGTFLAFDRTGQRVLIGGYRGKEVGGPEHRRQPTRVRAVSSDQLTASTQTGVGPVAWRGDVPVQLVPPTEDRATFLLWNVDRNEPLEEFALPADHTVVLPERIEGMCIAGMVLSEGAGSIAALGRGPKNERVILVWKSGQRLPRITIPFSGTEEKAHTEALAFSPDGSMLALGSLDGKVSLWSVEAEASRPLQSLDLGRAAITSLAFGRHRYFSDPGPDEANGSSQWLLGAGNATGTVAVWRLDTRQQLMVSRDLQHEVLGLALSPDGTSLYAAGRAEARCWDVATGRERLRVPSRYNWLAAIALTADGTRLGTAAITVFRSGGVELYQVEPGQGVHVLYGMMGQPSRLSLTPDGKRAAALSQDWQAGVWEVATGEMLMRVNVPLGSYAEHADIRLTDDGKYLIVVSGRKAERWEVPANRSASPRKVDTWVLNPAFNNRLAVTPEGKMLLCRNETKSGKDFPWPEVRPQEDPRCVRICELQPGGVVHEIADHHEHAWGSIIAGAPDGSRFFVHGFKSADVRSNSVRVYAGESDAVLADIPNPDAHGGGGIDVDSTGTVLQYATGPGTCRIRTFSPSGQPEIASKGDQFPGLRSEIAFLRDKETGLKLVLPGASSPYLTLSLGQRVIDDPRFTPTGEHLIWGCGDGTVSVGDMKRIQASLDSVGLATASRAP